MTTDQRQDHHHPPARGRGAPGARQDARRLVTNADGANLHYGIASALSAGAPRGRRGVLATDERVVADMVALGRPEYFVLLNFSRDQLDRNFEIVFGRAWRTALDQAGADGLVVVANASDPLVTWAAEKARRVIWVDTATSWTADAALRAPSAATCCGGRSLGRRPVRPLGVPRLGLAQHPADGAVVGSRIRLLDFGTLAPTSTFPARSTSPTPPARARGRRVRRPRARCPGRLPDRRGPRFGRFSIGTFGRTRARLVLSKNPAGWAESLPRSQPIRVVLAIDSVAADGKDVSWLWDVDFEQLRKHVVCTGPRAYDLAVRLPPRSTSRCGTTRPTRWRPSPTRPNWST